MKTYPSINKDIDTNTYIYAFNKLDGSNFRCEWNSKRGFYKFGTRNQLIDESSKPFGRAINLIKDKFESDISLVCKEQKWRDALFFFEFYGDESFAGNHNFEKPMTATLIDVNPHKMGLLEPTLFLKLFKHLDIPKVLYEGHVNDNFIEKVKNSKLDGMDLEGVVCKGKYISPGMPLMFKIKSKAWLNKLKDFCKDDTSLFERLA